MMEVHHGTQKVALRCGMQVVGLEPDEKNGVWADPELRQEGARGTSYDYEESEHSHYYREMPRTLTTARTRKSTSRSMSFDGSARAVTKEKDRAVDR